MLPGADAKAEWVALRCVDMQDRPLFDPFFRIHQAAHPRQIFSRPFPLLWRVEGVESFCKHDVHSGRTRNVLGAFVSQL